jgi:signal transduction histidine kinase
VRQQSRVSQDSLLGFLSGTGLPLVSRLTQVVRWIAVALASFSLIYGGCALAFRDHGLWNAELAWSGALPALVAAPLYAFAWRQARAQRMQPAALGLFLATFALSILATWPRGAFCTGWYMQPFLAMLATCCLGVVTGLSLTLGAVLALLLAALVQRSGSSAEGTLPDLWLHATSLSALTLASALVGALVHKLLLAAVQSSETQRRRNLESSRALRHREKLLRHALRVETVGDLASMIVHQLRNAFQVMMAHVSFAASADGAERERRLQLVEEMLRESAPLLDQLMMLAHPDDGSTAPADLSVLIDDFHRKVVRVMPAAVTVRRESDGSALPVLIDPRGLEHALWNLVINARQSIAHAGQIILRTRRERGAAVLEVEDTGCGIPAEIKGRIFDPYFTTKPPGQGTGLGLTAVARFVRGNNGAIRVRSEVDHGSRFELSFPLREVDAASA